jgi:putative endonuclease
LTGARRALGARGEELAASWYLDRGYEIVDRNWRCRDGEIDIVATRGSVLVVCEVKTRSSDAFGSPAAAVTPAKQRRLRRLAMAWLDGHGARGRHLRFDVAAVVGNTVTVIEGAF